jgi:hypothetical protein
MTAHAAWRCPMWSARRGSSGVGGLSEVGGKRSVIFGRDANAITRTLRSIHARFVERELPNFLAGKPTTRP